MKKLILLPVCIFLLVAFSTLSWSYPRSGGGGSASFPNQTSASGMCLESTGLVGSEIWGTCGALPAGTTTAGVPDSNDKRYMTEAEKLFVNELNASIWPCNVACDGTTDDSSTLNSCITSASATGGATILMPYRKVCNFGSSIVPKDFVIIDFNGSLAKWSGAASGKIVENDASGHELYNAGVVNAFMCGEGCSGTTLSTGGAYMELHSSYGGRWQFTPLGYTPNADMLIVKADVASPNTASLLHSQNNIFGPFGHDAGKTGQSGFSVSSGVVRRGLRFVGDYAASGAVTNNTVVGPSFVYATDMCIEAAQNTDTMNFEGNFLCTLTTNDTSGSGIVFNNMNEYCVAPSDPISCCIDAGTGTCDSALVNVYGYSFNGPFAISSWYRAAANMGKKGIVINKAGAIKFNDLHDDAVFQSDAPTTPFWGIGGSNFVVDNYGLSYDIDVLHGWNAETNTRQHLTKSVKYNALDFLESGSSPQYTTKLQAGDQSANIIYTLPTTTASGTSGTAVLTRDAAGALYWRGIDATTASYLLPLSSGGNLTQSFTDTSPNSPQINVTAPTANRFPAAIVRIWYNGQTGSFPSIQFSNIGGTSGSPAATANGINLGKVIWQGGGTSGASKKAALISVVTTTDFTDANQNSDMTFSLGGTGTSDNPVEKMRIMSSGNVGIGTTTPQALLDVKGIIITSQTTTPTATSNGGSSSCTVAGTDESGVITCSATSITTMTLTFNVSHNGIAPYCSCSLHNLSSPGCYQSTVSATAPVFTINSQNNAVMTYVCR